MLTKILPSFALSLMMSTSANAVPANTPDNIISSVLDEAYIYDFAYSGGGCLEGELDAVLTEDGSKVSIFFDNYQADSSADPRGRSRVTCNMGFALHIPQGLSVSLIEMDYRGYADIAPGGYGALVADYFFAGDQGLQFIKEWGQPDIWNSEDFLFENDFLAEAIVWSACGTDEVILRANTSLKAYEGTDNHSFIQLDTVDANIALLYHLSWKECPAL
ncbi:DUF4360 domain-containing protein [Shewanella surugensis]|uniref:DUF4360 domain-containing protein n=1 Tax=Shewanella surugensis TaxID=212020 RepID=A0ABT0LJM8_9GAMM|nr:DUF4360 domain-containing protein [Shewanella surugensis]MCL1127326.1 DUF4360 domain-containing protein [Shewanella surugensis]